MRLASFVLVLAACASAPVTAPGDRAGREVPEQRSALGPSAGPRPDTAVPVRPGSTRELQVGSTREWPGSTQAWSGSTRERLVAAARRHLGQAWRGDCSNFVEQVYREAGLPLTPVRARSASEGLWLVSRPVPRPHPGDLAFFHDTFDRAGDGRRGQLFTHVAMVEAVAGPRVTLIHRSSRGIQRLALNLSRRHDPAENGWLRKRRAGEPPGRRLLSGELFAAYGSAVPADPARR